MKHFTLLLVACILSLSATAQRSDRQQPAKAVPGRAYAPAERVKMLSASQKAMRKAPAKLEKNIFKTGKQVRRAASEVVYSAPEGQTFENMARTTTAYYSFWGYSLYDDYSWLISGMTIAEDGDIYLLDPITNNAVGSYLRLSKTDVEGEYVAQLPQPIYEEYYTAEEAEKYLGIDQETTVVYNIARFVEGEEGRELADKQEIRFFWDGKTLSMEDDAIMGLTDDEGGWYSYGDENFSQSVVDLTPVTEIPGENPVSIKVVIEDHPNGGKDYTLADATYSEGKVYLSGLTEAPGYIVGDVDLLKGIINVKSGQYLGPDYGSGFHEFFMAADTVLLYDDYYEELYTSYTFKNELNFNLDMSQKMAYVGEKEAMVINVGLSIAEEEEETEDVDYSACEVNYVLGFVTPIIRPFEEVAATPATPIISGVEPYDPDYGYGLIYATIPTEDVDGNFINPEKLSYRMYFDDEQVTFSADDYMFLDEDLEEIPYTFDDDYDLDFYYGEFWISFFADGMDKVGIQSVYRGGGEEHESEIAWYAMTEDGIRLVGTTPVAASNKTYDLQGRLVKKAGKGLYIVNGKKILK